MFERHQREWKECLNSDSNRDPPAYAADCSAVELLRPRSDSRARGHLNHLVSASGPPHRRDLGFFRFPDGQVYAPRLEPTAPIRLADRNHAHYPSRHCTILKKRRLNNALPAHMIPSTRESSEDVYPYTGHTKSMVWLTFFPAPGGQPVKWLRHQIHGAKQENL